jgi:hypothetical protein
MRLQKYDQIGQLSYRHGVIVDTHLRYAIVGNLLLGVSFREFVRRIDDCGNQLTVGLHTRDITAQYNVQWVDIQCLGKGLARNRMALVALQINELLPSRYLITVWKAESGC